MNSKNYKLVTLAIIALLFFNLNATAQVGVGTSTPNANAMLDVESTDKGFLPPRMTTAQKTSLGGSLAASDEGMTIYDTDLNSYNVWNGVAWVELGSGGGGNVSTSLGNMYFSGSATSALTSTASKLNGSGVSMGSNLTDFTSGDNILTYTGTETKVFTVNVSLSFTRPGSPAFNQGWVSVFVSKGGSGTAINGISTSVGLPVIAAGVGFIDNETSISLTGTVELAQNEYIEVWAESLLGSMNISVNHLNVVVD